MTLPARHLRHCLSFDIEEHFQVAAFSSPIRRRHWDQYESRVERNTWKILEILNQHRVRATFFILGWVAERHEKLVREIAAQGHEVASHGFAHELITAQTPAQFREDIRKSKSVLEDVAGVPVYGYRAPTFSITKETQWALPILVEEGYAYDSSIFPVLHDRYGVYGANPHCHEIQTASGTLWEVPPSTVRLAGVPLPIAGGGYFRLFPYPVTQFLLRKEEASGHPLVLYIHPWELDPEQPRMSGPVLSRFRHYINLTKTEGRMRRLLSDFAFSSIAEIIQPLLDLQNVRGVAESLKPKSFYTGH